MISVERKIHTIDAENKKLGRLASEIAIILRGKNKPQFRPNVDVGDIVHILNVDKLNISQKKQEQKKYYHYSGYPGGIKEKSLKDFFEKTPDLLLKKVVYHMLPTNKLRDNMIKRLVIK